MQSTNFPNEICAGFGAQMIGVGQHYSAIELFHLSAGQSLHCAFGANRHVDGGEHISVGKSDGEGAGKSTFIFEVGFERSLFGFDFFLEGVPLSDIGLYHDINLVLILC